MNQYTLVLLASLVFLGLLIGAVIEIKENVRRKRKSPQIFRGYHG